jgi:hypothetical protein
VCLQTIVEVMHRLTQEVSIQTFLASELLLPPPKQKMSELKKEEYHFMSTQINLVNTFLYMVRTYFSTNLNRITLLH